MFVGMISVITPTYNSSKTIQNLCQSLNQQGEKFEWVVVDNNSSDNTVDLVKASFLGDLCLSVGKDCGIYDAINKGVAISKYDFYLVIGSDDVMISGKLDFVIETLRNHDKDIYSFNYYVNDKIINTKTRKFDLYSPFKIFYGHSGSLVVRKSIHSIVGFYDLSYKVIADQIFLRSCLRKDITYMTVNEPISHYCNKGFSAINYNLSSFEKYKMGVEFGDNRLCVLALFIIRIIKWNLR